MATSSVAHASPRRRGPQTRRPEEAEDLLSGQRAEPARFAAAADRLLQGAQPLADNAFKIDLAHRAIVRALTEAAGGTVR